MGKINEVALLLPILSLIRAKVRIQDTPRRMLHGSKVNFLSHSLSQRAIPFVVHFASANYPYTDFRSTRIYMNEVYY